MGSSMGSHSTRDISKNTNNTKNRTSIDSVISSKFISDPPMPLRISSIKFLGKQGWQERLQQTATGIPQSQDQRQTTEMIPTDTNQCHHQSSKYTIESNIYADLHSEYGRLAISEREIEALMMGGASELPNWEIKTK